MFCLVTLTLILWQQAGSIRIIDLQVPGHAAEGGAALLGCQFDLEGEELYSVKWYKDGREFYRYVPSNSERTSYFAMPGVTVDVSRSSSTVVALERLVRESAGLYRCEVSGEAPYFVTVYEEKTINIHLLPKNGPRILGLQTEYQVGDILAVNCTSQRSRPRAQISWLVNSEPAPVENTRGPWVRLSRDRSDAQDTIVELRLTLTYEHFIKNPLIIQCQASIAPLYQNEVIHQIQLVESEPIDTSDDIGKINSNPDTNFVIASKEVKDIEDIRDFTYDSSPRKYQDLWTVMFSIMFLPFFL